TQARTVAGERERALGEHQAKDQPEVGAEQAEALLAEARQALEERRNAEAELVARLAHDDKARVLHGELAGKIAERQRRAEIFAQLRELIGSADGRQFRVFAQSLTLEALVAQANHHLGELLDRYRLQRVPDHDLELQVIDRDMGDEIRSIQSLSGGESFLVSLALALGLSSLSAQDVRIESLLIDEGFGTLDPDTLDIALSVLDTLQASGRKVGLISHVPGLAERVGVQIAVMPRGGGRSDVQVLG
ncbi:MAG: nuclease SbcCD subunit C, partial [Deltaproteobacteria bacterium]|nr:nuclease SbcCD subunit C [Deltaproteobacteria bacterium]